MEKMETRRNFFRKLAGLLGGTVAMFSPCLWVLREVFAKMKTILPKGTTRESLINKNPASLDARNLEITPLRDFGTMGLTDHDVDLGKWRLEVTGAVKRPLSLRYEEILALPAVERDVLLICPGFFANHGRWKGVSFKELMEAAGAARDATHVTVRGPRGNAESVMRYPVEHVVSDQVFLAYEVNGKPLPEKHGYPLRAVAEDYYGYDWTKFVYSVTVEKI